MRHQQPKLSCGIDTINNRLVKSSSIALAKPMTIVINKSIEEHKVSSVFKIARIIPLYKKGAANDCGNYRPVSLLSALSKILEKVICKQMMGISINETFSVVTNTVSDQRVRQIMSYKSY